MKQRALPKCPICLSPRIRRRKGTLRFGQGAGRVAIPDVEYDECLSCGERITDYDASKHIDSVVLAGNASGKRAR